MGNAIAFGGYFKRDIATGSIKGELVDLFGRSEISGNLWQTQGGNRRLTFSKVYRESAIFPGLDPSVLPGVGYDFSEHQSGGWMGVFVINSVYKGRAFCQIALAVLDAFGILDRPTLARNPISGVGLSFLD